MQDITRLNASGVFPCIPVGHVILYKCYILCINFVWYADCMSPTTAVGATSLTTAGCSAIVCGPVVAVAVVIVIVSIIMAATFIIIKRKQHLDTSNPSYNK